MDNWPQPRVIKRNGNFPYKFKIIDDYPFETGWELETSFDSKWLTISTSGLITVKANESGYAWDGCTPKLSIFNLFIIGTPDGHVDYRTMEPFTHNASLVHDVLYQYLDTVPVSKEKIDLLFLKMLGDFKLRRIYYYLVKHFGGWGVTQNGIEQFETRN